MFLLPHCRTTSDLENFQNHILMDAGKRYSYNAAVYPTRTLLAAIDYNCHNCRLPSRNRDGHKMYVFSICGAIPFWNLRVYF